MFRRGPDPADQPMPPDRYAELVRRREAEPRPAAVQPVPPREPAAASSELASELLAESAARPLESGELLLLSEEASLADLEAAAAGIAPADVDLAVADEPPLAALNAPRLLSPRIWEALAWSPPLAEHLRLLEAALLTGATVGVTMFVGHLETFPERVEHLMRLRDLSRRAADNGGRLVLVVEQADPATLPATDPRLADVVAAARPSRADTDTRHAMAVARLALGAGVVRG